MDDATLEITANPGYREGYLGDRDSSLFTLASYRRGIVEYVAMCRLDGIHPLTGEHWPVLLVQMRFLWWLQVLYTMEAGATTGTGICTSSTGQCSPVKGWMPSKRHIATYSTIPLR